MDLNRLRRGELRGERYLKLSCDLDVFPPEIFSLTDSLEVLDLSGNQLTSLPDEFASLHKLKILFCSDNLFKSLPTVLGRCPNLSMVGFKANQIAEVSGEALPPALRWLILTDNQLSSLPDTLGERPLLQKLMLAGNHLETLPDSLQHCHRLELLRISANRFSALPDWLWAMPRLSWLAYAGNPCTAPLESTAQLKTELPGIPWSNLDIGPVLGQGASGFIHRGIWRQDGALPVAVKVFKGAVTSDGLPQSEMGAALRAGRHPGLIPILGQVVDHPQGVSALVMSLLPDEMRTLAGPPSFDTCTRDVYDDSTAFELRHAINVLRAVADVMTHLHAHGIAHGDLYAHNLMQDGCSQTLLSDFGAATLYELGASESPRHQQLEVRAFACLMEELLQRCKEREQWSDVKQAAWQLQQTAASVKPSLRPAFHALRDQLDELSSRC